ncbi:MAG: response regulator transcription factor [Ignavibacteriaceae bacterium]|nr:response regulator transcription factor [Ignavibacteriaceae bacterium]
MSSVVSKRKLLIVDDHEMVRKGIWSLIKDLNSFSEFREASSGAETIKIAAEYNPDFIFVDISLPDILGTELIQKLRDSGYKGYILVLTMHDEEEYIYRSFKAGASGFLPKSSEKEEIEKAIYAIIGGIEFYIRNMNRDQVRAFIANYDEAYKDTLLLENVILTNREREVLLMLYRGHSMEEAADAMSLSTRTIEVYRTNLLAKYRCKNMQELFYLVRSNEFLLRKLGEIK